MRECVVDTETTGLVFGSDRIVEIGAVELVDKLPTGRVFHRYVNPEREVSERAQEIHGLSTETLQQYPVFRAHAAAFLDFIRDDPLVIHHAEFDIGMLNAEFSRLCLPDLINPVVDTLPLARKAKKPRPHTLDAMCDFFGIDRSRRDKHGALLDCELLAEVYLELCGGRQRGFDLPVETVASVVPDARYGPRVFVSRITPEERTAHARLVQDLGSNALWRGYLGLGS